MKKRPGHFVFAVSAIASIILFFSCQKEVSVNNDNVPAGMNKVSIYLTDGPTDYQNVFIDIQQIAIKLDTCAHNDDDDHNHPGCDDDHDSLAVGSCEIWDTLAINPGVYDLMTLRNGLDTLLASGFILNGKIERIKITLGTNNSVVVDSVSYPLHLLNGQNYVYVNIRREHLDYISSNSLRFYLDFDLERSIRYMNGQYWLKPVLRPFGRHSSGEIEGKIRPLFSHGMIKAYNSTDTAYAWPWWQNGEFKLRGLHAGTYSVFIDGVLGYRDTTITGIVVQQNRETDLGVIQLQR